MKSAPHLPTGEATPRHLGSIVVALALLVGWIVVAVFGALHRIDQLAQENARAAAEQLVWLTRIVAFTFNVGVLVVGAWVLWYGHRICRASRFPLPGMTSIPLLGTHTGRKARIIGWVAQALGLLVFVLGTTATWLFVEVAQVILRS